MIPTDETPDHVLTPEGLVLLTEDGKSIVVERPSDVSAEDDAPTP